MLWNEMYGGNKAPSFEEIQNFINNSLWDQMNSFIKETYSVLPELSYSTCSGQPRVEYKI
jgi:hypothetical protein